MSEHIKYIFEDTDLQKAMAIELLPAKELKKQAEVPVDFSALMQKALKYDIKPKKKGKK